MGPTALRHVWRPSPPEMEREGMFKKKPPEKWHTHRYTRDCVRFQRISFFAYGLDQGLI